MKPLKAARRRAGGKGTMGTKGEAPSLLWVLAGGGRAGAMLVEGRSGR